MKSFSFESKQLKTRYFVLWRISGDSGVTDRGTYLFQTDNLFLIKKLHEYCGSNCDDRQTYRVLFCSVPYEEFENLDDELTEKVYENAIQSQELEENFNSGRPLGEND